jgi:hypothetical protein
LERSELRDYATDAIQFWEPRRIIYNLALATIVIIYFRNRLSRIESCAFD